MMKRKKGLVATKKKGLTDDISEKDDDFDPNNPDEIHNGEDRAEVNEDSFYDEEMEEESDVEREVERQFDFVPEIAILVDYNVIKSYVNIINHKELNKNPDLIIMITHFFKRIVQQLKQVWIFYQFDFLNAF